MKMKPSAELETLWYELPTVGDDASDEEHGALAQAIFRAVDDVEQEQPYVLRNMRAAYEKFAGYVPAAMNWSAGPASYDRPFFPETRSLIRSGVETSTALIAQHMPKATPQTDAASILLQRIASQLDQFLVGAYYCGGIYNTAPSAFRDSSICGNGVMALVPEGKGETFRVKFCRIHPSEVVVADRQCLSEPTSYTERYRVTRSSRHAIKRKYGVDIADDRAYELTSRGSPGSNNAWVIEAIHIDGDDRRKVVCCAGRVLEDIDWPFNFFPYIDLWWSLPVSGFYGDGIATRQYTKQARIDYLHQYMHKALNNHLKVKVFNGPASSPTVQQVGGFAEMVSGRADPAFVQMPPPSSEVYRQIDTLFENGMMEEGISMATAGNVLPSGLTSAPAQQEYSFKESQRFSDKAQRYEHAIAVEAGEKLIAMYQHAALTYGDAARVTLSGRDFATVVDWPDFDMEADVFKIRIGASSLETLSPAGRMQQAQNYMQNQMIGPVEARLLADHPDLAYLDDLALASRRYCDVFAGKLLNREIPAIDPTTDLVALQEVLLATYNRVATIDLRESTEETREVMRNTRNRLAELDKIMREKLLLQQQQVMNATAPAPGPGSDPSGNPTSGPGPGASVPGPADLGQVDAGPAEGPALGL